MDMTRDEFIKHIKENYRTDADFDRQLSIAEHSDTDGGLIYEDDHIAIGKYFYSMQLENRNGEAEELRFCIYSLYTKFYVTPDDYEFDSYVNIDYIII